MSRDGEKHESKCGYNLRPCPFCGSWDVALGGPGPNAFIECRAPKCGAMGPDPGHGVDGPTKWNTRAPSPAEEGVASCGYAPCARSFERLNATIAELRAKLELAEAVNRLAKIGTDQTEAALAKAKVLLDRITNAPILALGEWTAREVAEARDEFRSALAGTRGEAPKRDDRAGEWKLVPGDLWRRIVAYIRGSRIDGSLALERAIEDDEARHGG